MVSGFNVLVDADDSGDYCLLLELDDDTVTALSVPEAREWVATMMAAQAAAEYDAAVIKQLKAVGMDSAPIAQVLLELRALRPQLGLNRLDVELVPGVNRNVESFVHIMHKGEVIGQWDGEQIHCHVLGVLDAIAVLPLDGGYLRVLRDVVELDDHRARFIVAELGDHRDQRADPTSAEPEPPSPPE